jgi:hypothetical protein
MRMTCDVFRQEAEERVLWIAAVPDVEAGMAYVTELMALAPSQDYFILDQRTGGKIVPKFASTNAPPPKLPWRGRKTSVIFPKNIAVKQAAEYGLHCGLAIR